MFATNFTCAKWPKWVTQYQKAFCVREYHIYKDIWEAAVGEIVVCILEPGNFHDSNTVAVETDGRIFGHFPRKVSRVCALLLKIGGTVRCTVTGRQQARPLGNCVIYHIIPVQFFAVLIIH